MEQQDSGVSEAHQRAPAGACCWRSGGGQAGCGAPQSSRDAPARNWYPQLAAALEP